jgi:ketosteroid isomerase-like protein
MMSCVLIATALNLAISGCQTQEVDVEAEKARIEEVINASIGWAKTKDTTLLYGCFAHDEELFWFTPEGGINHGFADLQKTTESIFLDEAFKAIRHEIRDLFIGLAQSGDVAWFHCILDDENEFDGQPFSWINVRWTGVLEKRDGHWLIVQQHFSNVCM